MNNVQQNRIKLIQVDHGFLNIEGHKSQNFFHKL